MEAVAKLDGRGRPPSTAPNAGLAPNVEAVIFHSAAAVDSACEAEALPRASRSNRVSLRGSG